MAKPTAKEQAIIDNRNKDILEMDKKGYPREYICSYYKLSKGRVSLILKKLKQNGKI